MSKNAVFAVACLVVMCVAGFGAWKMLSGAADEVVTTPIVAPVDVANEGPGQEPAVLEKAEPIVEAEAVPEPVAEPVPEVAAVGEAEAPTQEETAPVVEDNTLTAETLAGTKWKEGPAEISFLPDGRWEMNGRICAKWEVEGSRVKIFNDKGEVHYVEIVGDSLVFNGKKVGRAEG